MHAFRDGVAQVRDGKLVVTPPEGRGRPARVLAAPGVTLSIGGDLVEGEVELHGDADVEAVAPPERPVVSIEVLVSADHLAATMRVDRRPGARRRLADTPPNQEIVLRGLVVDRIACPMPQITSLERALADHGVVHGIQRDGLLRLLRDGGGTELVARGTAAVQPRDATVVFHTPELPTGEPTVRVGQVIATVTDAAPGAPGRTVLGEEIPVAEPRAASLAAGRGTERRDDGRIVATIAGHANVHEGHLCVGERLRHPGDVVATTGDLTSPGSIEIGGAVAVHCTIRARHDVVIEGRVRGATVHAGGSLMIGGDAVDSELTAGRDRGACGRLGEMTGILAGELERLQAGVVQVIAAGARNGGSMPAVRAFTMVAERVAPGLENTIRDVFDQASRDRGLIPREALTRLRDSLDTMRDVRSGRLSVGVLEAVVATVRTLATELEREAAAPTLCSLPSAQGCTIDVCGTLAITGRGLIDSMVTVVGAVELLGEGAFMRGGELRLAGSAQLREVISSSRVPSIISLAPGARLTIGVAHAGLVLNLPAGQRQLAEMTHDLVIGEAVRTAA